MSASELVKQHIAASVDLSVFPNGIVLYNAALITAEMTDLTTQHSKNSPVLEIDLGDGTFYYVSFSRYSWAHHPDGDTTIGIELFPTGDYSLPVSPSSSHTNEKKKFLFHAQSPIVDIKRSNLSRFLSFSSLTSPNSVSTCPSLQELAILQHMQHVAKAANKPYRDVFPHNIELMLAATDGHSVFAIFPTLTPASQPIQPISTPPSNVPVSPAFVTTDLFTFSCEDFARSNVIYENQQLRAMHVQQIKEIMRQILVGLTALHRHEIAHRDLRLETISIGYHKSSAKPSIVADLHIDTIRIVEFGLSVCSPRLPESMPFGKLIYLAPECLPLAIASHREGSSSGNNGSFYNNIDLSGVENRSDDLRAADIWSIGVILFALLFQEQLWSPASRSFYDVFMQRGLTHETEEEQFKIMRLALHRRLQDSPAKHALLADDECLVELLTQLLLRVHPPQRATAQEVLQHPWFTSGSSLHGNVM
jgi:serine/threonine protein kinase